MARRLANKKQVEGFSEPTEDLYEEEVGEYSELEQALNRIGKKLRKKKTSFKRSGRKIERSWPRFKRACLA
jgi:uncharacterized protein YukE